MPQGPPTPLALREKSWEIAEHPEEKAAVAPLATRSQRRLRERAARISVRLLSLGTTKIILKPKPALAVRDLNTYEVARAIMEAAGGSAAGFKCDYIIMRLRPDSNIVIVSTALEELEKWIEKLKQLNLNDKTNPMSAYVTTPEYLLKGVIHARHLGGSKTALLMFDGDVLPRYAYLFSRRDIMHPIPADEAVLQDLPGDGPPHGRLPKNSDKPMRTVGNGEHTTGAPEPHKKLKQIQSRDRPKPEHQQHRSRPNQQGNIKQCWLNLERKRTVTPGRSKSRSRPESRARIHKRNLSGGTLKKCWENLKDKWRRTNGEDMREWFATGCQDMYDESTDLWSWDDNSSQMEDASTNTARPHGQVQDASDSQPRNSGGATPSEAAAVPSAASSSAAVPAGTKCTSTCSSQRQTAVSIELGARLDAIKGDPNFHVTASKNEWMSSDKFQEWLSRVWGPNTDDVRRLLVLDQAPIHKTQVARNALDERETDVAYVPAGCTSILQPADVYWNQPFKANLRRSWEELMRRAERTLKVNLQKLSHQDILNFMAAAWEAVPEKTVAQSFKGCGISNMLDGSEEGCLHGRLSDVGAVPLEHRNGLQAKCCSLFFDTDSEESFDGLQSD
ncbi:hypothetical protein HPB49_002824 [Dermacentor silvarum]|uniref:Uncharacterized protein n=1 Tax=Dermacentor silvarum TaxID=543639 RepID=A0ACB8CPA9_DERSI|nr:hypothetical protein HPB49_002824 [Dermacentor silvarum]